MIYLKLKDLIFDKSVYPRPSVDEEHVNRIVDAMASGASMPPIVVEGKSKIIVDGFHRYKGYSKTKEDDFEIEVVVKEYASKADLYLDAVRLNAEHGKILTDLKFCQTVAQTLGIDTALVASALHVPKERLQAVTVAKRRGPQQIETPSRGKHGKGKDQIPDDDLEEWTAGRKPALYYVNHLLTALKPHTLMEEGKKLRDALEALQKVVREVLR